MALPKKVEGFEARREGDDRRAGGGDHGGVHGGELDDEGPGVLPRSAGEERDRLAVKVC